MMEKLLTDLANSDLKRVSKATGIPYDRMYKWVKGVAKPKMNDYNILKLFFENGNTSTDKNNLPKSNGLEIGQLQQKEGESSFVDLNNGKYLMVVPKVPVKAQAGYIEHYYDEVYIEQYFEKEYFVVNQVYHGNYMSYVVDGDSMDDGSKNSIIEGSTVLGRDIKKEHWSNKLHLHRFKDYIIVHKDGIFIKRIINHDVDNGIITCHSLNQDKDKYPDFDLFLGDCLQILNVVRVTQER